MAILEADDLMQITRGDVNYSIKGSDMKQSLFPNNRLAPLLPPFTAMANTGLVITNSDSKIQFSLDQNSWSSSLSVVANQFFHTRWTTGIDSAAQGTAYSSSIGITYTLLDTTHDVDVNINTINRVPGNAGVGTFQPQTNIELDVFAVSNTVFPQDYNTPSWVWCTTDSSDVDVQIGDGIVDGVWVSCPTAAGTLRCGPRQEIRIRHKTHAAASTTTTTTLFMGYGTSAGEYQSAAFITTTEAKVVNTPTIIEPSNGATGALLGTTIAASVFDGRGTASVYKNTDWQLSTTADYNTIVEESLADSINTSSWNPTLNLGITYYPRMRYRATDDTVSEWSPAVNFATDEYLPAFDNGSYTWPNQNVVWTVPEGIGKVSLFMSGQGQGDGNQISGGKLSVQFDVRPGEQFNWKSSVFGLSTCITRPADPAENTANGANGIFAVVGYAGWAPSNCGGDPVYGRRCGYPGQGGYPNGQDAETVGGNPNSDYAHGGGGGTQTSGGAYNGVTSDNPYQGHGGTAGGFLYGGSGREADTGANTGKTYGGGGGMGWYGGGGGGAVSGTRIAAGGGGGSSHTSIPNFPDSLGGGSRNAANISMTYGDAHEVICRVTY